MKRFLVVCLAVIGCAPRGPAFIAPSAPDTGPRPGTVVNASFAATWSAAVDVFAESNVTIQTIDRESGLLIPAGVYLGGKDTTFADCGRKRIGDAGSFRYATLLPTSVRYNVRVKGDSSRSTVQVNAAYGSDAPCVSRGKWETQFEQAIKIRSERPR